MIAISSVATLPMFVLAVGLIPDHLGLSLITIEKTEGRGGGSEVVEYVHNKTLHCTPCSLHTTCVHPSCSA